jgi:hypothetical protein
VSDSRKEHRRMASDGNVLQDQQKDGKFLYLQSVENVSHMRHKISPHNVSISINKESQFMQVPATRKEAAASKNKHGKSRFLNSVDNRTSMMNKP